MAKKPFDCAISRATSLDLTQIAPLFDAYRAFFAGRQSADESRAFLQDRFSRGESVIFLAKVGEQAVGFIQLYPLWSSWYCRRIWFLSDLYVGETARKRGIGARLVDRAVEYARETNAVSIMVELPRREPHLTEFYARLGFHRDDVFELARHTIAPST